MSDNYEAWISAELAFRKRACLNRIDEIEHILDGLRQRVIDDSYLNELGEPEYDCPQGIRCPYIPKSHRLEMVEQRCMTIEKRLQALEGKANNEVATDISDELPELHVGNYVEVVGQPYVTPGLPVGTIDRVSYQAPFGWFTLEGSEAWYPLRSLRKLSDDEIIAKIGRERKA